MRRCALTLLFVAGEALAHPHHGPAGWLSAQLGHLLTQPDHLAMMLLPLVLGVGWVLWRARKLRAARRASSTTGYPLQRP